MGNNTADLATSTPNSLDFYVQAGVTSPTQFPQQVAISGDADAIALYQTVASRLSSGGDTVAASSVLDSDSE